MKVVIAGPSAAAADDILIPHQHTIHINVQTVRFAPDMPDQQDVIFIRDSHAIVSKCQSLQSVLSYAMKLHL